MCSVIQVKKIKFSIQHTHKNHFFEKKYIKPSQHFMKSSRVPNKKSCRNGIFSFKLAKILDKQTENLENSLEN